MANYSGIIKIDSSWTALKNIASLKNLAIQYDNSSSTYDIFCLDGRIAYATVIFTGPVPNTIYFNQAQNDADKTDFETNYKDIVTNRVVSANATSDGYAITTASPLLIAGSDGSFVRTLKADSSGRLITVGLGTAGSSLGGVLSIQGVSGGTAIPVSGTVTATNASVSTTATTPPGSATYIGGSVTTAAPTYTTAQMNALSLTTAGSLRIDGSGVTQPISAASLPLPTGASTETTLTGVLTTTAFQARINTLGQKTMANSTPVVLSSDQSAIPVTGTFFQATQPISGTVTANIGTSGSLALDATLAKLTIAQSTALGSNTQAMVAGSVTTAAPSYTTGNINPLSLTTAGALRVDNSANTQPISGTIAATQSGTWTVQPGNTANTTPWLTTISQGGNSATVSAGGSLKVDNSANTQPVSGTITANIGTSGSLALDATIAKLTITQGTALGSNTQAMVAGSVTTAAPAYTTGNINPLSLTTTGSLRTDNSSWIGSTAPTVGSKTSANSIPVVIASDQGAVTVTGTVTATNASVSTTGSAPPASATYIGGSVTTAAPAYTTGQMSALSLTTTGSLRVDNSANTQPISGTITANIGTSGSLALDATLTGGTATTRITDGTNTATVKAASTAAVATDKALVVAISPNNSITASSASTGTTGSAVPTSSTLVGGSDGTNLRSFITDTNGMQYTADVSLAALTGRISGAQAGNIRGNITTAAITEVAIRNTTYTEQSSNAQRSVNSLSANDTSAGTGARTVQITYYSISAGVVTGPFTETITMNGTTAVNTTSTTICFIEKMEVITVGSTGSNVGAVQIFTTTAGGGSVFASIAATARQTQYAHHYVANGRTCYITDIFGYSTATSANVPILNIRAFDYGVTNASERFVSNNIGLQGSVNTTNILFPIPRKVSANNRVIIYVTPANGTSQTQNVEFSFYEI